ncbi:unnamed protein product [Rotaria sp. Silwood2]|nr:unnamed protein product [Rotaria sp. Silwood2]CAF4135687.1 unnamed protein product [Rotaria sp. Silwood2]
MSYMVIHTLPILAVVTNALILLVVLTNSQLNCSSFSVYIKSMAISDTLVLVLKLLSYENKTSQAFYSPSMCTGLIFLSDATKQAIFRRHRHLTNHVYRGKPKSEPNESQLMLMLLIVTIMFTVYFLPFTIINIISKWGLPFDLCFTEESFEIYFIVRSLCEFLKDLNFCTNFIIYCISGRRFRHAFFFTYSSL